MAQAKRSERNKARRKFIGRDHSTFDRAFEREVEWDRRKKLKQRDHKLRIERIKKRRELRQDTAKVEKRFGFIPRSK